MSPRSQAILFAVLTAFFWGVYGPALGNARSATREWSNFKPYLFIGVAYLVWGVIGGSLAMKGMGDSFSFADRHFPAAKWGFLAGSLGAFGALTLTFAVMNAMAAKSGPGLVMPIVFGGAVTVTAITQYLMFRAAGAEFKWEMGVGMILIVIGIVMVAKYTPHGGHAPAKPPAAVASVSTEAHQ
ncbi:MAG: hypothetical protein DWH91_10430 [Planctomycetota bacterium]|nr:MAG: hypothetical protein DWH91_10430 [Planctomycetota bacterium]